MKYLLDTHIFLWWLGGDSKLSPGFKSIISNPESIVFLSVASVWEISIKVAIKKLDLKVPLNDLFTNSEFEILPIKLDHVIKLHSLPPLHKDPFDRMLIAQAQFENLTLLSNDEKIKLYTDVVAKSFKLGE